MQPAIDSHPPSPLPDTPDFATLLRTCRVAAGMSQEALAERAGVTERSVRNIERGAVRSPRPETVQLIGAALGFAGDRLEDFVTRARARYWEERGRPAAPAASAGPAQLPMDVGGFTGRAAELAALDSALAGDEPVPAVVISAVAGTAGVGKTALAVRWAHTVAGRFPDGQLYVNLRGYDPASPLTPGEALIGFLAALGVRPVDIPLGVDDRAALYRSRVHGRRLLVVLDNAASVAQVRPLLPGSPTCVTVVTSRDSLSGLVALHGARRIDLGRLPAAEAVGLLRRVVGARVDAEPTAAAELAEQCARLPLALRVAGEFAALRPGRDLAELVGELADGRQRLALLAAGDDEHAAVRNVLSWSYRHLPPAAAAVFRALGQHPGTSFERHAVAALAGGTLAEADGALDVLLRAHLVEPVGPGRYGMHDLLRAYAASLTAEPADPGPSTRLFDHYLATASAAMDLLYPAERDRRPVPEPVPTVPLADDDAARAWLDGELPNLVRAAGYAADHGWPRFTGRLASTLYRYLSGDHFIDGLALHTHALRAARADGDLAAEANSLASLGVTYWLLDRYEPAAEHLTRSLELYRRVDDPVGRARAMNNLALVHQWVGDHALAVRYLEQALPLQRGIGDLGGAAKTVGNLGSCYHYLGRSAEAVAHLTEALALHEELGDEFGEATNRNSLGVVHNSVGEAGAATRHLLRALDLYRRMGHRAGEGHTLVNLAEADILLGRYDDAVRRNRTALDLFRQSGDRAGEANALLGLGTALRYRVPADAAREHLAAALALAAEIGVHREGALAHEQLGHLDAAAGEPDRAAAHWSAALAHFAATDAVRAAELRDRLARLGRGP